MSNAKSKFIEDGYARVAVCVALAALAAVAVTVSGPDPTHDSWRTSPAYASFSVTTSSTIPPNERVCIVTFLLLADVVIGSLQFEAQYGRNVRFVGEGIEVECEPVSGQFWVVLDSGEVLDKFTKIRAAMIDSAGVSGPADLLACRVRFADAPVSSADIKTLIVTEATDTQASLLDPLPELGLRFECPMSTTTTTHTTTTTTTTTTTLATGTPRCGRPLEQCGEFPSATDALVVLFSAVGVPAVVPCPLCRCDLDGSGHIAATDALAVLRKAVRIPAPSKCPPGPDCDNDVRLEACDESSFVSTFPLQCPDTESNGECQGGPDSNSRGN